MAVFFPIVLFDPGTNTHYLIANFILAAIIAEKATSKTVQGLFHETILRPLNLKNTQFVPYERSLL